MSMIFKLASALTLILALAGCSQEAMQQLNRDLAAANAALAGGQYGGAAKPGTMARMDESGKGTQTQLIVPADTRTREAMDAALPTIKKVLAIHQCIKVDDGMLQLNYLTVPGAGINRYKWDYPNSDWYVKYHDRSKCMNVRAIDNWTMPALNALQFRTVYFADDSGETVNFGYLLKKVDDGSWKLQSLQRVN